MSRKGRREINAFSMSFLDVLSCALGGILVLFLITLDRQQSEVSARQREADAHRKERDRLLVTIDDAQQKIRDAEIQLVQAGKALEDTKAQRDAIANAKDNLERAQVALVGLKGSMENVVFVFDTSGSMAGPRFPEYIGLLQSWVKNLTFEEFNVIDFDDTPKLWSSSGLRQATAVNRDDATSHIKRTFQPDGTTNAKQALQLALDTPRVDTIVFFSDGAPNGGTGPLLAWLRGKNLLAGKPRVIINTVAMGDYFQTEYGEFLQSVARDHGGTFIGR